MVIAGHNRLYKLSIDSHLAIYASQLRILEARPNLYCGWRWLLLDTIAYPIFLFNNCLSDDNEIFIFWNTTSYQLPGMYQVYHATLVCISLW